MGRPSNTEARRREIIDALLSVMSREGYERATIASIAKQAELASGLIHYHFESKQEILVALVDRIVQTLEDRLENRLAAADPNPRARLYACIDAHVALGSDADPRTVIAWVVVSAEAIRQPEVRVLYTRAVRRWLVRLRRLSSDCLKAEKRSSRGSNAIASAILSAIQGAYLVSAAAPRVLPAGYAAPTLHRMVDGLLAAEPRR